MNSNAGKWCPTDIKACIATIRSISQIILFTKKINLEILHKLNSNWREPKNNKEIMKSYSTLLVKFLTSFHQVRDNTDNTKKQFIKIVVLLLTASVMLGERTRTVVINKNVLIIEFFIFTIIPKIMYLTFPKSSFHGSSVR